MCIFSAGYSHTVTTFAS